MSKYALPELELSVARVHQGVRTALVRLLERSDSAVWGHALRAVLAIHEAPQHHLRSQLVFLGAMAADVDPPAAATDLAIGLELLHLFILIHDDVMDRASTRRGQPTLHVALADRDPTFDSARARDLAIVVGNTIHVLAAERIARAPVPARDLVFSTCVDTGRGQFEDLVGWSGDRAPGPGFRRLLVEKGALHSFAAPFAGGFLTAAPEKDASSLVAWGSAIGVAFQALDDLTDLVGDPHVTGKERYRDLVEGRLSLALLLLRERATPAELELLDRVAGLPRLVPGDRAALDAMVRARDLRRACLAHVDGELATAARLSATFPPRVQEGTTAIERGLREALERGLA